MRVHLFETFSEMIEKLPAKGVFTAARLQRQMLSDDLARKRTLPIGEVRSILAFCDFLENAFDGYDMPPVAVPMEHFGFYRKTVKRLVESGELPFQANELFDATFSAAFLKSLKAM
jgi:hypothetical protein